MFSVSEESIVLSLLLLHVIPKTHYENNSPVSFLMEKNRIKLSFVLIAIFGSSLYFYVLNFRLSNFKSILKSF